MHGMGRAAKLRVQRRAVRQAVKQEIGQAQHRVTVATAQIVLRRGFLGRLRWLLTGK